ncbi:MAG TPA: MarR family transcriptional regulator [Tepidisphaeraceae bacterium]|nr:MarR family transcriptional regulator [Tepidisphaeraceae bacterium]
MATVQTAVLPQMTDVESPAGRPKPAPMTPVEAKLRDIQDTFIRRWGEMGATWGINRTMAEIHALMYIVGRPLCTDDVMERLHISRGNTSMNLRALCDWGLIRRMHRRGERREYFESLSDVWEMFSIIAAERKRREMDPVLETIKHCQELLDEQSLGKAAKSEAVQITRQRLAGMEDFMKVTNKIFAQFIGGAKSGLSKVVKVLLKAF